MKKIFVLNLVSLISICFLFIKTGESFGQNSRIHSVLQISKNNKIRYINTGRKFRIWHEGKKYAVKLDSISDNKLFSDIDTFDINKIEIISVRPKKINKTGKIMIITGAIAVSAGGFITIVTINTPSNNSLFLIGFASFFTGINLTGSGIGLSLLEQKYKKHKGWRFKTVQLN